MAAHANNEQENEIITMDAVDIAPTDIQAVSKVEGYINTLDLTTDRGKQMTIAAYNGAVSLAKEAPEVLNLVDVITIPGTRAARSINDMPTPCTNTYLITAEGECFFSQSDGIADSIGMICALYPDLNKGSEAGCLRVKVTEVPTSNGNTLKRLVPVLN